MKYKIGEWVIIKKNLEYTHWYHDKPMRIIEIRNEDDTYQELVVDYNFKTLDINSTINTIASGNVELYPMREKKLERIMEDENKEKIEIEDKYDSDLLSYKLYINETIVTLIKHIKLKFKYNLILGDIKTIIDFDIYNSSKSELIDFADVVDKICDFYYTKKQKQNGLKYENLISVKELERLKKNK